MDFWLTCFVCFTVLVSMLQHMAAFHIYQTSLYVQFCVFNGGGKMVELEIGLIILRPLVGVQVN